MEVPGRYDALRSLPEDFAAAQVRVKQLSKTPANDELLELYALYKQASVGDVQGSRPGMLDFKGRAKYDAWSGRKGTSKDNAMSAYVTLVTKLASKYG
jgi:acyl-CoA-binding protein